MNQIDDRLRGIKAKLDRLRKRAQALPPDVRAVLLGMLDLLEDEL